MALLQRKSHLPWESYVSYLKKKKKTSLMNKLFSDICVLWLIPAGTGMMMECLMF